MKKGQSATLHPVEFLRRFVQHVLPERFHKIRHFGPVPRIDEYRTAHGAACSAPRPAAPGSSNAALHHRTRHALARPAALTRSSAVKRAELAPGRV